MQSAKRQTVLDFVAFYPSGLWRAPGSPLHFLVWVRQTYVAASADPYARDPTAFPWFEAMTYVELLSEFPLAVYLAYKLALRKPTDGPTELAALVFASLTAMTSGVVCFDLFHLSHDLVTPAQKNQLLWSAFGPYTVIRESRELVVSAPLLMLHSCCDGCGHVPTPTA